MEELPDEVVSNIFGRISSSSGRNTVALVCSRFYDLERCQRDHLRVGCGLHPARPALRSLCSRFPFLTTVEVLYAGWMSKLGKQVDDEGLTILATHCTYLRDLSLSFCSFITDVGLSNLAGCSRLTALRLNFTPGITGRGLLSLVAGCKKISILHLTRCLNVSSVEWLEFLGHHGNLESLAIRNCRGIGEGDLAKLGPGGWGKLQELVFEVDANHRYMKVFGHLAAESSCHHFHTDCAALRVLSFTNCLTTPGRGLACVLVKCQALTELHLDMCIGLRDDDLVPLARNSPFLRSLSLRIPSDFSMSIRLCSPPRLTDSSLKAIARHCSYLEKVAISFADGEFPLFSSFTVEGILALVEGCSFLRVLVLDRAYSFNDSGMEALCFSQSLEVLELVQCQEVSDEGLKCIRSSNLKDIRLCRCLGISNAGFSSLIGFRSLDMLRVEDCPQITKEGIEGSAKVISFRRDLSWMY
ncbi:hypothetical protein O6H91_12G025700 [Diphasiastrum complanatum]|uniref:Uncharacterized protein n=3 Tax=Diphasiastrum complanatum TaxID=34168 RepID=A0ACC2BZP2_DIPCM|nr:hypothetical protein O6H91_12G023400 [Diphasiastrum complanatum]KAJ7535230.1 hypothetical protein O6H91_12G023400 [Diphasiastrum complanatum]KAJ7535266.1 hypothetical protein O6H91_12G025700 [Diphasiastrum complanatum]